MSHNAAVLKLLQRRPRSGLTAIEAYERVGTMRLAARVKDLRDQGYVIDSEMVKLRDGGRAARYRLVA